MKNLPKVLVVEDSLVWQEDFAVDLAGKVEIVEATNEEHAARLWEENRDKFSAVGLDAVLSSGFSIECETEWLAKKFHDESPDIPIISITNNFRHEELLVKAGCTHSCLKADFPQKLCEVFGIKGGE